MNKEIFIEQCYLYLMDELNESDKIEFENALMEDDFLRKEFEEIKSTYFSFRESKPKEVDERLLIEARNMLMNRIREESQKISLFEQILNQIQNFLFKKYEYILSGAVTVVVGILIGYVLFHQPSGKIENLSADNQIGLEQLEQSNVRISGIQFPANIGSGGQIEISFDAVKPVRYKGTVEDPFVQKLLATALVTGSNPGMRLRTVNTISSQAEEDNFKLDPKIKQALLSALKVDTNPAVRKEALNVLLKMPFDDEIRDGILFVLSSDKNSGLRVAAINALAELKFQGHTIDNITKTVLSKKAEMDNDNFIRIRAASILKEVE